MQITLAIQKNQGLSDSEKFFIMQGKNNSCIKGPEKIILKERSVSLKGIINFKDYIALVVDESNSCVKHRWNNTGIRRITTFRSTMDRIYDGGPIYYIIIW
jgi:hypothetical protein